MPAEREALWRALIEQRTAGSPYELWQFDATLAYATKLPRPEVKDWLDAHIQKMQDLENYEVVLGWIVSQIEKQESREEAFAEELRIRLNL